MNENSVDALLPAAVAAKAEEVGVQKVREDALKLLALGALAGAFIGLGAMFSSTVLAGSQEVVGSGIARLAAGAAFSVGLVLVIVGGAELFTGNALMVMALAAGRIRLSEMLRAWAIVYVGNFIGAAGCALLVFLSDHLSGNGVAAFVTLASAADKAVLPFGRAVFSGILANVLVCLAVWLSLGARSTTDKVIAIVLPVSAFVAAGFEHSIANMYVLTQGLLIKDFAGSALGSLQQIPANLDALSWMSLVTNLVPVTIGNVLGGGVLVGLVYWFVYLRGR